MSADAPPPIPDKKPQKSRLLKQASSRVEKGMGIFKSKRNSSQMSSDEVAALLTQNGIDPHLPLVADEIERLTRPGGQVMIDIHDKESLITRVVENKLAVPDWQSFVPKLKEIFNAVKREVHGGKNANYIPVLEEQDPSWFACSVCTVDGQMLSLGDDDIDFSIQSCVKPLIYSAAVEDIGLEAVHRHVGIEPSGLAFNEVSLNADNRPHNPMINAGAIASGSCVRRGVPMAERFKYFLDRVSDLAGGEKVGFSQQTYLCEHETAWRNNALLYFMTEAGVFPKDCIPEEVLDFYIQCCAIEVNTRSAANIAATLANGGICPLTNQKCLSPATVKSALTLMFSCGMYDYSGEWCINVGLPAKSGVAGLVYVVVPHVMGIAIFSPPLDTHGNSVRGVEFCKRLLHKFNYGIFDRIVESGLEQLGLTADIFHEQEQTEVEEEQLHANAAAAGITNTTVAPESINGVTLAAAVPNLGDSTGRTLAGNSTEPVSVSGISPSVPSISQTGSNGSIGSFLSPGKHTASTPGRKPGSRTVGAAAQHQRRLGLRAKVLEALTKFGQVARALAALQVDSPLHDVEQWTYCVYSVTQPMECRMLNRNTVQMDFDTEHPMLGFHAPSYFQQLQRGIPVRIVKECLENHGIRCNRKRSAAYNFLRRITNDFANDRVSLRAAITRVEGQKRDNILVRTLLGVLVLPDFAEFTAHMAEWVKEVTATDEDEEEDEFDGDEDGHQDLFDAARLAGGAVPRLGGVPRHVRDMVDVTLPPPPAASKAGSSVGKPGTRTTAQSNHSSGASTPIGTKAANMRSESALLQALCDDGSKRFTASVCTVDGQQFTIGNAQQQFPIMGTVKPLLYLIALMDVTPAGVHEWVGTEPTAADPQSFDLLMPGEDNHGGGGGQDDSVDAATGMSNLPGGSGGPAPKVSGHADKPKPYNPFMSSGALAVSALLGRGHESKRVRKFHDSGSRFTHLTNALAKLSGYSRVNFNNPVFLGLKQNALKTMAISHFMKGMGCYPEKTQPTDNAHLFFQACSINVTAPQLAVIGATIAAIGYCPVTDEKVVEPDLIRATLSLLFSCGLSAFTGKWQFNVGIPACCGSSGALLLVIPGVMAIVLHDTYNPAGETVPPRAHEFCKLLIKRYRVNIFDQLVYVDDEIAIEPELRRETSAQKISHSAMFFDLCTAAGQGDVAAVEALIADGVELTMVDYDYRSALHIACCEGQAQVVDLLLKHDHPLMVVDRWGVTPVQEAQKCGNMEARKRMLRSIRRQLRKRGQEETLDDDDGEGSVSGTSTLGSGMGPPRRARGGSTSSVNESARYSIKRRKQKRRVPQESPRTPIHRGWASAVPTDDALSSDDDFSPRRPHMSNRRGIAGQGPSRLNLLAPTQDLTGSVAQTDSRVRVGQSDVVLNGGRARSAREKAPLHPGEALARSPPSSQAP